MSSGTGVGSPGWVRPADVMRVRKLKAKKRFLMARISATPLQVLTGPTTGQSTPPSNLSTHHQPLKRRNPFKSSPNKRVRALGENSEEDTNDATLFQLLNPQPAPEAPSLPTTFSNLLTEEGETVQAAERDKTHWMDHLVLDWSLKSRLRFRCSKPLPWKHTFKTSEEASGTTGFVRCLLEGGDEVRTLDTSANAQFYQRCLVWQHPVLPWLGPLFPRHPHKLTAHTGLFGTETRLAETLRAEWSESLRSLHQLLRVRQCPYFYVCGPTFTCLFRAAGVGGVSEAHALITPTTRGLREAMKEEDIEFEMPFHQNDEQGDSRNGKEEEEEEEEEQVQKEEKEGEEAVAGEEGEEATSWLKDLGLETSQFPSLNPNRAKVERDRLRHVDSRPSSLVYVEGMETQALVNFLINSKSCVALTGDLAGVPPTLLAPVAFQGATLKPLRVKGGVVRQGTVVQHSMEVSGPVLPHMVHQLATLLAGAVDTFSIAVTSVSSSLPFSLHSHREATAAPQAFAQEGLVDCGLDAATRHLLSAPSSPHPHLPPTYREITYEAGKYTWTE